MSDEGNGAERDEGRPELTGRQRAFIDAWFGEARFNATRAAELAGYGNGSGNRDTWSSYGSQTLGNLKVQEEIRRRWAAHGVTAEEVTATLAAQMRGRLSDLLRDDIVMLDREKVRANGHLIKALRQSKEGVSVELYSAQEAAALIGKTLGMFVDRHEHEVKGSLTVILDDV